MCAVGVRHQKSLVAWINFAQILISAQQKFISEEMHMARPSLLGAF